MHDHAPTHRLNLLKAVWQFSHIRCITRVKVPWVQVLTVWDPPALSPVTDCPVTKKAADSAKNQFGDLWCSLILLKILLMFFLCAHKLSQSSPEFSIGWRGVSQNLPWRSSDVHQERKTTRWCPVSVSLSVP